MATKGKYHKGLKDIIREGAFEQAWQVEAYYLPELAKVWGLFANSQESRYWILEKWEGETYKDKPTRLTLYTGKDTRRAKAQIRSVEISEGVIKLDRDIRIPHIEYFIKTYGGQSRGSLHGVQLLPQERRETVGDNYRPSRQQPIERWDSSTTFYTIYPSKPSPKVAVMALSKSSGATYGWSMPNIELARHAISKKIGARLYKGNPISRSRGKRVPLPVKDNPDLILVNPRKKPYWVGKGYPKHVVGVYQHKLGYTVVFSEYFSGASRGYVATLELSSRPDSPQGVSQWSEAKADAYFGTKRAWGRLPLHIQEHILGRLGVPKFPSESRKPLSNPHSKAEERICYVCKNPIKDSPLYIGQGIYRHQRCLPTGIKYEKRMTRRPAFRRKHGLEKGTGTVSSKATKLFKGFHVGANPKTSKLALSDMKTLVHLGDITEIRYKPTGSSNIKGSIYRHRFSTAPKVLATADGKNVVIAGGKLSVKKNGIHG